MKNDIKILLLLAILLLASIVARSQTNIICGHVTDLDGANVAGVAITMSAPFTGVSANPMLRNGLWIDTTPITHYSDAGGYWAFTNVPCGQWEWDGPNGSFLAGIVPAGSGSFNVANIATNSYNLTIGGASSGQIVTNGVYTTVATNNGMVVLDVNTNLLTTYAAATNIANGAAAAATVNMVTNNQNSVQFNLANDMGGQPDIQINNRLLFDGTGPTPALDWNNRYLRDAGGLNTLDWNNRILIGAWGGNGGGLTNVPAASLTGTLSPTNLPAGVMTNIFNIYPNGTNDSFVTLQALFATPYSELHLKPGAYYISTNLFLTSNISVFAYGATIYALPSFTNTYLAQFWHTNTDWINNGALKGFNAMINFGTNNVNQSVMGLTLDGQQPSGSYQPTLYTGINNGFYAIGLCYFNIFGFEINQAAGGSVHDCTTRNMGGAGFFVFSPSDQNSYLANHAAFFDNFAYTNYIGFLFQAWGGATPSGYGNAEYNLPSGLVANNCVVGLDDGSSNGKPHHCNLEANWLGLCIQSGNGNSGPHSLVDDIDVNHCNAGLWWAGDSEAVSHITCILTSTNYIRGGTIVLDNCTLPNLLMDSQGSFYNTNNWYQFRDCQIFSTTSISNNLKFDNCRFGQKTAGVYAPSLVYSGGNVQANNNWCDQPITNATATTWLGSIITNANGDFSKYSGYNNYQMFGAAANNNDGSVAFAPIYVTQATNQSGTNIIQNGTNFCNSALQTNLAAGVWNVSYNCFVSIDAGGGGYSYGRLAFSTNAQQTVFSVFHSYADGGVNGSGSPSGYSGYPSPQTGFYPESVNNTFAHYWGNGTVTAATNWTPVFQFANYTAGTNHIWAGSSMVIQRLQCIYCSHPHNEPNLTRSTQTIKLPPSNFKRLCMDSPGVYSIINRMGWWLMVARQPKTKLQFITLFV